MFIAVEATAVGSLTCWDTLYILLRPRDIDEKHEKPRRPVGVLIIDQKKMGRLATNEACKGEDAVKVLLKLTLFFHSAY
jgi:hypothetical protein